MVATVALVFAFCSVGVLSVGAAAETPSAENSLQVLINEANLARDYGQFGEQKRLLEQALGKGDSTQDYFILLELANCCRTLDRLREARRYAMEAVDLIPTEPVAYITLAIMEKNSGQLDAALQSLARARERSRSALLTLQIDLIMAGYLVHAKQSGAAKELFERVHPIVATDGNFATNIAWFYAVSGDKENFYREFARALAIDARNTLRWVDEEADLDRYRSEERFKDLVDRSAASLESGW